MKSESFFEFVDTSIRVAERAGHPIHPSAISWLIYSIGALLDHDPIQLKFLIPGNEVLRYGSLSTANFEYLSPSSNCPAEK